MKKLFSYLVIAALFIGSTATLSAQKIAYVDSAKLLSELPEVKQAEVNLESLSKNLEKKYQSMLQGFQTKYQDLAQKQERGELSPVQVQDEAKKLQGEEQKILEFEQDIQKQIFEKRQALFEPIMTKIQNAINSVASENGYSFVLDGSSGAVLYFEDSADITEKVKSRL